MFVRQSAGATFDEEVGGGGRSAAGFAYRFTNTDYPDTVARRVVIPYGGMPRLAL